MKRQVLIIDDNRGTREQLEKMLSSHGFECYTVASGREALRILGDHSFPLVLCDLGLADMSGLDLVRNAPQSQEATWIAVTGALPTPDLEAQCRRAGFQAATGKMDLENNLSKVLEQLNLKFRRG